LKTKKRLQEDVYKQIEAIMRAHNLRKGLEHPHYSGTKKTVSFRQTNADGPSNDISPSHQDDDVDLSRLSYSDEEDCA
jgi:hypothetical protein